jgi:hypothetical protein
MATLQKIIADKFLCKLSESKSVSGAQIDKLRGLLAEDKKPKPEDFAKIFSLTSGDVK